MQKNNFIYHTGWHYIISVLAIILLRILIPAVICDDAYISFKTALNFSQGNGIAFNPGEKIYVVTTPLWVFLLAFVRFVVSDILLSAKILGLVIEVMLMIGIVRLGESLFKSSKVGMWAAIFLCTNPAYLLTSFSGMEISLYLLTLVFSFDFYLRKKYLPAFLIAAISVWVRFDGIVIYTTLFGWFLFEHRKSFFSKIKQIIFTTLPSLLVLLGYALFGYLYYGSIIPMSVQRKLLISTPLFSQKWAEGAWTMIEQFYLSFIGQAYSWYVKDTLLIILILPLIIGLIKLIVDKRKDSIPLIVFYILYIGSFVKGGSSYAKHFPWYFIPTIPIAYLIAAFGLKWLKSLISGENPLFGKLLRKQTIAIFLIIVWTTISFYSALKPGSDRLSVIEHQRERLYAAGIVWLGKHLGENKALVAANEIGAVGFFSRPNIAILDMFGLLRKKKENLLIYYITLLKRERPEAIITMKNFRYREDIEKHFGNKYVWLEYEKLEIGVRKKYLSQLQPFFGEIKEIYNTINLEKEYPWQKR